MRVDSVMDLYTFAVSHFSEKARWALDLSGIPYRERRLLPGPHLLRTRTLGKHSTVPILRRGTTVTQGSSAILDHLEQVLSVTRLTFPGGREPEGKALEALLDHSFGLGIQRVGYDALLQERPLLVGAWAVDGPWWARPLYAVTGGIVAAAVRRGYGIEPEGVQRARDRFNKAFDQTDAALRLTPYLLGDSFTRADLTLAALLAPLFQPPQHPVPWFTLPQSLIDFRDQFVGRPTSLHVLRMYREHRNT